MKHLGVAKQAPTAPRSPAAPKRDPGRSLIFVRTLRRAAPPVRPDWIGRDLSNTKARHHRSKRSWGALLLGTLCVALLLSALRVELFRLRYEISDAIQAEQRLLEERRELTVAVRRLRDPHLLARRADKLGLGRPERLIEIDATPPPRAARRSTPGGDRRS